MDIRSFFRTPSSSTRSIKHTPFKAPKPLKEEPPKEVDEDSDSSPIKSRLKKKSKVDSTPTALFDEDEQLPAEPDHSLSDKVSVRELYQLEDPEASARQVNLTEFFDGAPEQESKRYKPKHFITPKLEEDPTKQAQNVDFSSYLDSIEIKRPHKLRRSYSYPKEVKTENKHVIRYRKFVFTGVLKNIDRDSAIDTIKRMGGFVVSGLSAQVDYLVYGEFLEDGRPFKTGVKYKKFCDINKTLENKKKQNPAARDLIKLVDEEEFLKMIDFGGAPKVEKREQMPAPRPRIIQPVDPSTQLWVEKYAPTHMDDFICNHSQLNRLRDWLQTWKNTFGITSKSKGSSKSAKNKYREKDQSADKQAAKDAKKAFKCALVSGPPGIGKTTYVRIIATMCNFNVMEFNASDQRNKSSIERISIMATGGVTINCCDRTGISSNTCIIMDEVDGISSGDRGGSQAIHRLIEKSFCPIICICNDRYAQNIRTLATKCLDLKFLAPTKQMLFNRLRQICNKEKVEINDERLNMLCESTRCDIRQCLNTIQFSSNNDDSKQDELIDDMNKKRVTIQDTNSINSPFEMAKKVFSLVEEQTLDYSYITDCFFTFYDILPLFMNENYLKFIKDNTSFNKKWHCLCSLANSFVIGDIFYNIIYNSQLFALLPELGHFTTLVPVVTLKGFAVNAKYERIDFPQILGRLSSTNKNKRLLHEFSVSTATKIGAQGVCFSDGVSNLVYTKIINYLKDNDINEAVELMISQGVTKDFLTDCCSKMMWNNDEDSYDKLPTKTKSTFTRKYNSEISAFETKTKKFIVEDNEEEEGDDDFIVEG